jgi:hypothetical protein
MVSTLDITNKLLDEALELEAELTGHQQQLTRLTELHPKVASDYQILQWQDVLDRAWANAHACRLRCEEGVSRLLLGQS